MKSQLPVLPACVDEERMIQATLEGYMAIRERMTTAHTLEWLETTLKDFLRRGLIEQLKVIEAAEAGDEIAHRALVCVFAEMQTPPAQLKAYVERAALRGPPGRKAGRCGEHDFWKRDIGLVVLVYWAAAHFGLKPTRNRYSLRARRPSGASIVVAALQRVNVTVSESRLNNLWGGLGGAVVTFAAGNPSRAFSLPG